MSDLVRAMAMAMKNHCRQHPHKTYSILAGMRGEEWLPLAHAALLAMREPPEAAIEEGMNVILDVEANPGLVGGDRELAYRLWQAMVDEAAKR